MELINAVSTLGHNKNYDLTIDSNQLVPAETERRQPMTGSKRLRAADISVVGSRKNLV